MTLEEIKKRLTDCIDQNREEIIRIGRKIQQNPELGYNEEKTSALVRKVFEDLDITYTYPLAVTGVKGRLCGRTAQANICIIGEMDALRCEGSPIADTQGIAHACGHNAQMACMLGVAIAFQKSGVMDVLDGDITFMATPAEEFIELEQRKRMKECGQIQYFGGKQQLIAEGAFDDVDAAMMVHAQPCEKEAKLYVRGHNLGFMAKTVTFHGKAVHGSTPFDGVNALNAAALAILGIHANRETFREEDRIRIHPIITKGGDVVNSVPDKVCIETYVRGAALSAIQKGNRAVEKAAKGAAQMIGAEVTFEDMQGYLPLCESRALSAVFEENAARLIGDENLVYEEEITGSTDMGDLSCILPVIQPSVGGFCGTLHSREFETIDEETAYLLPAKVMAMTAAELLYHGGEKMKKIKAEFAPVMTKSAYIAYLKGDK